MSCRPTILKNNCYEMKNGSSSLYNFQKIAKLTLGDNGYLWEKKGISDQRAHGGTSG